MADYEVKDYGIFNDAVSTNKSYNEQVNSAETAVNEAKTTLSNSGVLMGPFADECVDKITKINVDMTGIKDSLSTMSNHIIETSSTYKAGDTAAENTISSTTTSQAGSSTKTNGNIKSSVEVPSSVAQAGYTVTCYGEGGWHLSGKEQATPVAKGTNQESVHNKWVADGARYKNGIAVMNVDGVDHYLVATAPTFGKVGDSITVNFENGQSVPMLIADAKSTKDSNYTTYGHGRSDGSVNILEFEVDRNVYNAKSNPRTSTWGLEWDSSSDVSSIDNYGSIL